MSRSGRDDEPFLQRWSRRKQEVRRTERATERAPARDPGAAAETQLHDDGAPPGADLQARSERPHPTDAAPAPPRAPTEDDFADVDFSTLDYGSDYTRFMEKGVPESIRQKALSQLWKSDPIFTQIDPFQDYAGDYTDAATAVPGGLLKTAYKVGQGFLSDEEAAEWDKLGKTPDAETIPLKAEEVRIAREDPDQSEVRAFFAASEAYMAALYPAASNHFVDIAALQRENVRFLVARQGARAVGCGAIVLCEDGSAEIKRMWVEPPSRGLKIGARLLSALEDAAHAAGAHVLRLETGIAQPEALALYRRAGFIERPPFANYAPDPLSLFMEKPVQATPPRAA
jgi:putative acetyltransferase